MNKGEVMYHVIDTLNGIQLDRFVCPKAALAALGCNTLICKPDNTPRYVVRYVG